jgi:hypothetical protein
MLLVDLMDEDFVSNTRSDIVSSDNELTEADTRILVVLGLSINNIHKCTAVTHHSSLIRL